MIYFCLLLATIAMSLPASAQETPPAPRELNETIQQLQQQLNRQQEELRELQQALPAKTASPASGAARKPARIGFFVNVEPQWILVHGLEREFAAKNNTAACPGGGACLSASGRWATVDARDIFAPKLTAGFISPDGNDIFSIGGFHAESTGGTARFNPPGNVIGAAPLDVFDEITNVGGNAQPLPRSADATNSFAMDQLDFDYERVISLDGLELTPELGVRSLFFKNELKTSFNHIVPGFSFNMARASRSTGLGPKVGMAADWRVTGPFSVRARGASGYLIGYNESEQLLCLGSSFANPGCGRMHSFQSHTNQGFPFIEGEFALQYKARRTRGLSAAAGYRLSSYLGLVTLPETVGGGPDVFGGSNSSVQRDIFQRHDVTISSFFFRLQYLF